LEVGRAPIEGSGFGATITYQSRDPRIVQATGGEYTTYAFEWGWLDLWYKLGLLGLVLVLAILFRLGYGFWRLRPQDWQTWAIIIGLVSLATVHFFTPYLNHPLGFGILIALEAGLFVAPIASRSRE
jgi:O-antigen ligase